MVSINSKYLCIIIDILTPKIRPNKKGPEIGAL